VDTVKQQQAFDLTHDTTAVISDLPAGPDQLPVCPLLWGQHPYFFEYSAFKQASL
jgi:hypothetical protein